MPMIVTVLVILALICFLVGTIKVQPPTRQIDWTCAGLGLLVLAYLVRA
jgi:hypothetical protein